MLSQTCINLFLVLNTKYDILENVGNQTVAGPKIYSLLLIAYRK